MTIQARNPFTSKKNATLVRNSKFIKDKEISKETVEDRRYKR